LKVFVPNDVGVITHFGVPESNGQRCGTGLLDVSAKNVMVLPSFISFAAACSYVKVNGGSIE
jgi:hypothetical protein